MTLLMAIESSCDETAVCLMDDMGRVHAHALYSQVSTHAPYGGVVPELAARAHTDHLDILVTQALNEAGVTLRDIDIFAATTMPGLMGGLIVGATFAKTLAMVHQKRFLAVHHLQAHALSVRWEHDVPFPYLLLLVSGGHCQLIRVQGLGSSILLGETLDDAAGEAFDKAARLLALGFPGGPAIETAAAQGDPNRYPFEIPLKTQKTGFAFSFSGLKTALAQRLAQWEGTPSHQDRCDLAASFQQAIAQHLMRVCARAFAMPDGPKTLVVAGGVAANATLRAGLTQMVQDHHGTFVAPRPDICTDNAIMIAWAAWERLRHNPLASDPLTSPLKPRDAFVESPPS
jgi:N6-L-threonylcarbamoyladenine synthase